MIFTNNKPTWLKIILALAIMLILSTYIYLVKTSIKSTREESYQPKVEKKTGANIKKISDEIDHGLYEIKVDDSTTVLLYRGVNSCTMIKK
jgi:membrane protein implicated in regulation of membrane protease activity